MRSPPPRNVSPHRYAGVYDELLSPPRRSIEPPHGARYGSRSGTQPPGYAPPGVKQIPPLGNLPVQSEPPPGYRGRYDGPPFEDIPPGVEPPVPGFEPSPFEKPFGPPGPSIIDRDRLPPSNYREPYRPPPYNDGPGGYRDMPIPPLIPNEIPVHVGEQSRFRDNYRPGHYREPGPPGPFRDGQPYRDGAQGGPYRDPNFRGGPPPFREGTYRNIPYRDGAFRDNPPHIRFPEPSVPYRAPSADPRESIAPAYHEPNFRENYREENGAPRDHARPGFRSNARSRGGPRRNPNAEYDRHRDREPRDRERYNENREINDKPDRNRDTERRGGHDKTRDSREGRDDRPDRSRDYEKNRDYEKEREYDRSSPDKKSRVSPKRNREIREKKRSESRGRSRDRENRREKKEERIREKTSADRTRDHKDKDKKIKDRKKKKREKDKDADKKKKRDKKDKKEKDLTKKENDNDDREETKDNDINVETIEKENSMVTKTETKHAQKLLVKKEAPSPKVESNEKPRDDLYGDEAVGAVDKEIIENYVKTGDKNTAVLSDTKTVENASKEEPFDGIELQATADELDLKAEIEVTSQPSKEMLASLPELSKWEVDDDNVDKVKEPGEITSHDEEEDGSKVTSDVIKRAENAIFAKAINSLRPIEIKKISSDRLKLYGDETPKTAMNNIQITVPVTDLEQRSIEINEKKKRFSKTPPPRLSVKDRLGGKVEDVRRGREPRVVHSTVERVKSKSKTPKRDQPYRRVTVERERGRKLDNMNKHESSKSDRRIMSEAMKSGDKHRGRSPGEKKHTDKTLKEERKLEGNDLPERIHDKNPLDIGSARASRERKKSILDESHFEPDYDETVESDNENKPDAMKKRERSTSPNGNNEIKRAKLDNETIKLDLTNVKKKPDSDSESTSDSEYSSSSSSSDARKRKKKKKRSKKKKKRAASDSESDSESSSDDHKKKKKKRKHLPPRLELA